MTLSRDFLSSFQPRIASLLLPLLRVPHVLLCFPHLPSSSLMTAMLQPFLLVDIVDVCLCECAHANL